MKILVIEHMPKRERAYPTKIYRVAERGLIEKPDGKCKMLKEWTQIKRDLTRAGALHELQCQRVKRFNQKQLELVS